MEKNSSEYFLESKTIAFIFFPFFTTIILLFLFCIILQSSSGYTEGDVLKVISMKLTQDQYNYKHLIGILQNNANKTVNNVIISANFFDKTNKSIGNFSKQSEITTINPGEITPFDILIYNKDLNDKINKFSITVKFNFTNHK